MRVIDLRLDRGFIENKPLTGRITIEDGEKSRIEIKLDEAKAVAILEVVLPQLQDTATDALSNLRAEALEFDSRKALEDASA